VAEEDFIRPLDKKELHLREAVGAIRASRFVRRFAKSKDPITVEVIYEIHKEIFKKVLPEIAGKPRKEAVTIWRSKHLPPHHLKIPELLFDLNVELQEKLGSIKPLQLLLKNKEEYLKGLDNLLQIVAWVHHKIVWIHPFSEGNGRTARLMANLILERYGLRTISTKNERENKDTYFNALQQIDEHGDYQPLIEMIVDGLVTRYDEISGVGSQ